MGKHYLAASVCLDIFKYTFMYFKFILLVRIRTLGRRARIEVFKCSEQMHTASGA